MTGLHGLRDLGGNTTVEETGQGLDDGHFGAAPARTGGKLQPDETTADDGDTGTWLETLTQIHRVFETARRHAVLVLHTGNRQGSRTEPVASRSFT